MSYAVRKGNYFNSSNIIFEMNLSIYAKMVYIYLSRLSDEEFKSFPKQSKIAERCSCGVTKVKDAINELIDAKLLEKQHRYIKTDNGKLKQTSNLYILHEESFENIKSKETMTEYEEIIINSGSRKTAIRQTQDDQTASQDMATEESQDGYNHQIINLNNIQQDKQSIYQSILKLQEDKLIEGLNTIYKNCKVELYDSSIKTVIKNSIVDMYFTNNFSNKINIPKVIIQQRLLSMDMNTIDRALANYKNSIESGITISAPMKYFEKCIWTAICDDKLDLFSVG